MSNGLKYETGFTAESFGMKDAFGLEIRVAGSPSLPDLKEKSIQDAFYKSADLITKAIRGAMKAADPNTAIQTANNLMLVDLFSDAIYVDEIPNEYCSDWCCKHLPWFIVTTHIGRFKIGWRKRVILIDWSGTACKEHGRDLFPDEETTTGEGYIHAWGLEDAEEYIKVIIDSCSK